MQLAERGQNPWYHAGTSHQRECHIQFAVIQGPEVLQLLFPIPGQFQNAAGIFHVTPACVSRDIAIVHPVKKLDSQFPLKLAQVLAQRRLGDIQFPGRLRHILMLGYAEYIVQLVYVHKFPPGYSKME